MRFTQSELELIYQYAMPGGKDATLTELRAVRRAVKEPLTKAIVENTIDKLLEVPEPECSRFIADTKARFLEQRDQSIRDRLAAARAQEPPMLGHDLFGLERYSPHTRHMVVVDILTSDSPVGFPGERYRFFLSDEGYKNAKKSAERGEIKIRSHAERRARTRRLIEHGAILESVFPAISAMTGEEVKAFLLTVSHLPGVPELTQDKPESPGTE